MGKKQKQESAFSLEGRFLGFEVEDGYKIKRLWLATAEGEYCIKLTKESRASVQGILVPGDWIMVSGCQTLYSEGEVKFKAFCITQSSPRQRSQLNRGNADLLVQTHPNSATVQSKTKPQATILVCQKSDCIKRGGKSVCQALQASLSDRGLTGVAIKGTGCMKQCKAGPNLVMPDKTRYSRIDARDVPAIVDRHFPQNTDSETMEIRLGKEAMSAPMIR